MVFEWPVRVYYEDTDAGGVVYHSQYLNYCERARTEWLRSLGIEQTQLIEKDKVIFVVHSLSAQYKKPAKFDDALIVHSRITSMSRASVEFHQIVMCEAQTLFELAVKIACVDLEKMRACLIPNAIATSMKQVLST